MAERWTVRRVLAWTAEDFEQRGIESARLEAELLAASALGMQRIGLYLDLDRPLTSEELSAIRALVGRRRKREPVAYILGEREFYGRKFEVGPEVLIPRPDTETLVEQALVAAKQAPKGPWVDLCTGSGAVGIVLALEMPDQGVTLTDISAAALRIASRNVESHGLTERVHLVEGDGFAPLATEPPASLLTVNPPYIPSADIEGLDADVRDHEPRLALDGGRDGLDFYRRLATEAPPHVCTAGVMLMEIGFGQHESVPKLFGEHSDWTDVRVFDDLAGTPRVVRATRA